MRKFVTAAALVIVAATSACADESCRLDPKSAPAKPSYVEAVVTGPANDAEVMAQTRIAIERVRAPVSPAYVALPRIDAVFKDETGVKHHTIAAIPSGLKPPRPGDRVTLSTRYRDPKEPCAFIPWLVVGKGEPA